MRKSERIRLLEIEVAQLKIEMQYLTSYMSAALESLEKIDLESGKWYKNKSDK